MDRKHRPNPRDNASVFNRLFFCWLWPIFAEGKNHDLKEKDLYDVFPENLSETNTDALETNWTKELKEAREMGKKISFFRPIWNTFKWRFLKVGIHVFISHFVLKTIEPIMVGLLIWHFDERSTTSSREAYSYATIFVIVKILDQLLFNHIAMDLRNIGISARVACTSLIYRKILRLSCDDKQVSSGRLINLMSNDTARLEIFFLFLHILWVLPIQSLLITYLIWHHVGITTLIGVGLMIVLIIPLLSLSGKVVAEFRRKIAIKTDDRIILLSAIVRGIRVIKMYTWEKPFERFIVFSRRREMKLIARSSYLRSFLFAVTSFSKRTPLYVTIIAYVLQGNTITAYKMFMLVQYFNILFVLIGSLFMRTVGITSEGIAAMRRIKEFLLLDEVNFYVKRLPKQEDDKSMITIKDVSVATIDDPKIYIFNDVNVTIKRKSLTVVVGPVGAGKTLLLKLMLNELRPTKGEIVIHGDVSYSSQEPWLYKGTLKENVLFGESYDKFRYDKVIEACALLDDFKYLCKGDETVVGEYGTTLSGGQCARVNLARAVYRNADVYLLDDPFSSVDTKVGNRLWIDCINGLLKDKTRILITHQAKFIKLADEIIVMNEGRVEYQGTFTDKLLQNFDVNLQHESEYETNDYVEDKSLILNNNDENEDENETHKLLDSKEKKENEKIIVNDTDKLSLYWKYFTSCGSYLLPILTVLAFAMDQLFSSGSDYYVTYWSKHQKSNSSLDFDNDSFSISHQFQNRKNVVCILAAFTVSIITMSIAKAALCTTVLTKSNERIHNFMVTSLIRAKIKFYEINDSGRILNRFSKDTGIMDERLQTMLIEAAEYIFITIGVLGQILLINKYSIIIIFFMGYLFYKGRKIVIKTTRNIMRLDGQMKSPIFYHVNSTLAGRLTIRSCKAQYTVIKKFDNLQDDHTAASGLCQYSLIAYSCWLDCITMIFISLIVYGLLIFKNERSSGADVGLAITQLISLTGVMSRAIKLIGDIETNMIAAERMFQYTKLEQEETNNERQQKPPNYWADRGKIKFVDLSLRYFQSDTVILKNLNFTIEAGEKIGIIGRTGSGKSSLTFALFRLARLEGAIYIDDLDTRKIGLKYLRNVISIIPQKPILFPVTLRKNLDPRDEYDDLAVWSALRDVELNKIVTSLDVIVDRLNLSTGQCQLLCLARVILKNNKIVVLDEATANVDDFTDSLIQKTIKCKFKDCTVLTITHRLNKINDMDKILVLDNGRIAEYDRPEVLLRRTEGHLTRMMSHK